MDKQQKIELIAEILDLEAEDISEDTLLADMEEWDSVAILSFIAMMDEKFNKQVNGAQIRDLVSVKDALNFMN